MCYQDPVRESTGWKSSRPGWLRWSMRLSLRRATPSSLRGDMPISRAARAFEHACLLGGMEVQREYRNASTAYAYVRAT